MAAVTDTSIWLNQEVSVSKRTHTSVSKPAVQRHRPVRVKLRLLKADTFQACPPDGELKLWWDRLKKALGTVSSDFVNTKRLNGAPRCGARTRSGHPCRAPAVNSKRRCRMRAPAWSVKTKAVVGCCAG
jgi:hypothetical protein